MDLRTNQEGMGVQTRYSSEYGSHMFKAKETFEEADIKGNNNIFNSLKTEQNVNHSHEASSLDEVKCSNKKKLEVDNSLFSYSSFKKAMDLRVHNRTLDGGRRSIFDDAENFAKNHRYKLLPITFEQVDETVIQSEHNYSLFSLTSESEPEEDCSRMMVYTQVKEKNYKRRRTKFRAESEEEAMESGNAGVDGNFLPDCSSTCDQIESFAGCSEPLSTFLSPPTEGLGSVQPLDLSAAPPVKGEKTDSPLRERPYDSAEKNCEVAPLDSDKENIDLELNAIRVTITRPDEKENYQPCDLFLNDIARLVPWLIDKDCFEVDILDRTCDGRDDLPRHRLYYVISEPTWRLFQTSSERVILTNDRSLGQPLRRAEKGEKPSYLVFDQFSLAKCLAEYCQEIGGCFEYTCVEEGKDDDRLKDRNAHEAGTEEGVFERMEKSVEVKMPVEALGGSREEQEKVVVESVEKPKEMEGFDEESRNVDEELTKAMETVKEEGTEGREEVGRDVSEEVLPKAAENPDAGSRAVKKVGALVRRPKGGASGAAGGGRETAEVQARGPSVYVLAKDKGGKEKGKQEQTKGIKVQRKAAVLPEPINHRVTTRSKSTSESETSQKSDERVSGKERRKRGGEVLPKAEPPRKRKTSGGLEDHPRRTRSGKVLEEVKANKETTEKKESAGSTGTKKKRQESQRGTGGEAGGRSLRSAQRKGEEKRTEKEKRGRGSTVASSKSKHGRR